MENKRQRSQSRGVCWRLWAVSKLRFPAQRVVLNQRKHFTPSSARTRSDELCRSRTRSSILLSERYSEPLETGRALPAGYIGLEILVNTQMSRFSA